MTADGANGTVRSGDAVLDAIVSLASADTRWLPPSARDIPAWTDAMWSRDGLPQVLWLTIVYFVLGQCTCGPCVGFCHHRAHAHATVCLSFLHVDSGGCIYDTIQHIRISSHTRGSSLLSQTASSQHAQIPMTRCVRGCGRTAQVHTL